MVRIVDLAKGSFTEVDLSSQHLSPGSIALNSTDAWVIAAANENTNNSTINVVQISRATHKFVTTFPLDSGPGLNVRSIVATDNAVWISVSGSSGPVLYKIDATSTPTGYAVKAPVGVASQTSNSVLVGSGSIWLLVSNNSEILKHRSRPRMNLLSPGACLALSTESSHTDGIGSFTRQFRVRSCVCTIRQASVVAKNAVAAMALVMYSTSIVH